MGRVVVVLLIGTAVVFAMVLKMPLTSMILVQPPTKTVSTNEDSAERKVSKPRRITTVKRESEGNSSRQAAVATNSRRNRNTAAANGSSTNLPSKYMTRVVKDSALYSFNSPTSRIVQFVKEGDVVDKKIEVIDAWGSWTLVSMVEQKGAGYIPTDNLGRRVLVEAGNE